MFECGTLWAQVACVPLQSLRENKVHDRAIFLLDVEHVLQVPPQIRRDSLELANIISPCTRSISFGVSLRARVLFFPCFTKSSVLN